MLTIPPDQAKGRDMQIAQTTRHCLTIHKNDIGLLDILRIAQYQTHQYLRHYPNGQFTLAIAPSQGLTYTYDIAS